MRPIILLTTALLLAACATERAAPVPSGSGRGKPVQAPAGIVPVEPDFDHYAVDDFIAPEAVAPNLKALPVTPEQAAAIREGAENGVAFAGFFAVAAIPCGRDCVQFALVDGRDGRVILGPRGSHGADYRHHSRLFVIDPPQVQPPGGQAPTRYYVWNGRSLVPLQS